MRILFTAKGSSWDSPMDPRFGRMNFLVLYDEEKDELTSISNEEIDLIGHGAGLQTTKKVLELNPDVVITGDGPGRKALEVLDMSDVVIYVGAGDMSIREAYDAFKAEKLEKY